MLPLLYVASITMVLAMGCQENAWVAGAAFASLTDLAFKCHSPSVRVKLIVFWIAFKYELE